RAGQAVDIVGARRMVVLLHGADAAVGGADSRPDVIRATAGGLIDAGQGAVTVRHAGQAFHRADFGAGLEAGGRRRGRPRAAAGLRRGEWSIDQTRPFGVLHVAGDHAITGGTAAEERRVDHERLRVWHAERLPLAPRTVHLVEGVERYVAHREQ